MEQKIYVSEGDYCGIGAWIQKNALRKILVVGKHYREHQPAMWKYLSSLEQAGITFVHFGDYEPNPKYESVVCGVELYHEAKCSGIISIGGGSAIDVAKCIKLYSTMDPAESYLKQKIIPNEIPFLAVPTTAGTGSESTRFAVIYYNGVKQSVHHESCIPDTVLLDASSLQSLPIYQRKATMMDALCHAVEAMWSVHSTEESRAYSTEAIREILKHQDGYLYNTKPGNTGMLLAANKAGHAINIAQTTAGHAMCYKITSLFGCAHGHAAILCIRVLLRWTIENTGKCADLDSRHRLEEALKEIAEAMGCSSVDEAAQKMEDLFANLQLDIPEAGEWELQQLTDSVNPVRLKNYPIDLDKDTIKLLYRRILRVRNEG